MVDVRLWVLRVTLVESSARLRGYQTSWTRLTSRSVGDAVLLGSLSATKRIPIWIKAYSQGGLGALRLRLLLSIALRRLCGNINIF